MDRSGGQGEPVTFDTRCGLRTCSDPVCQAQYAAMVAAQVTHAVAVYQQAHPDDVAGFLTVTLPVGQSIEDGKTWAQLYAYEQAAWSQFVKRFQHVFGYAPKFVRFREPTWGGTYVNKAGKTITKRTTIASHVLLLNTPPEWQAVADPRQAKGTPKLRPNWKRVDARYKLWKPRKGARTPRYGRMNRLEIAESPLALARYVCGYCMDAENEKGKGGIAAWQLPKRSRAYSASLGLLPPMDAVRHRFMWLRQQADQYHGYALQDWEHEAQFDPESPPGPKPKRERVTAAEQASADFAVRWYPRESEESPTEFTPPRMFKCGPRAGRWWESPVYAEWCEDRKASTTILDREETVSEEEQSFRDRSTEFINALPPGVTFATENAKRVHAFNTENGFRLPRVRGPKKRSPDNARA